MKHAKRISNLKLLFVIGISLFAVAFAHLGIQFSTLQANAQTQNTQILKSINSTEGDPDYATKDYWISKFGSHDDLYLDDIAAGDVLNEPAYFINHDITVKPSSESGVSGIIIKGNVTLYFEKPDDGDNWPTLTVQGSDGTGQVASGCGIEVEAPNSLTIKGRGTIVAKSGNHIDNSDIRSGKNGANGVCKNDEAETHVTGYGGAGGSGSGGIAAVIGTKGSAGGAGGKQSGFYTMTAKQWKEVDGKNGDNGEASSDSTKSGNVDITGDMTLNLTCGTLGKSLIRQTEYGKYECEASSVLFPDYWCSAGGAGGGSGGMPFVGAFIGTGGAGGGGGGAGGGGGHDRDASFVEAMCEDYALLGGGGGAGYGSVPNATYGGRANPYNLGGKIKKAIDGQAATVDGPGKGGTGTKMNDYDGDNHKGGTGGNGGKAGYAGEPGLVRSTTLEKAAQDPSQHEGRDAEIQEFYPLDECALDCVGGMIDPDTRLHCYFYDQQVEGFVPDFRKIHFPTGKDLGMLDKDDYEVVKREEGEWDTEHNYKIVTLEIALKNDNIENQEINFYLIDGVEIEVESTLSVEKIYDGSTKVNDYDVKGNIELEEYCSEYKDKLNFIPEWQDFSSPDAHDEDNKQIHLKIEVKEGETLEHRVYLKNDIVEVPYKITKLQAEVQDVEIEQREYIKGDLNVVIENVTFVGSQKYTPVMGKDYNVEYSHFIDVIDAKPEKDYTVEYKINSLNPNMVFKDASGKETDTYIGKKTGVSVEKATISVKSVNAQSRNYRKENYLVEVNSAEFEGKSPTVSLDKNIDYEIEIDDNKDKGKITDGNCYPGTHKFECTVELLSVCYQFDKGETSVSYNGDVEINKITITLDEKATKAVVREYDYDDYFVDIDENSVQFNGAQDLPPKLDDDYTVTDGYIKDDTCDAGPHNVVYGVILKNTAYYQFADASSGAVGETSVNILQRTISVDSVECVSRAYAEGNFDAQIDNVKFGNLGDAPSFDQGIDYAVDSCKITDSTSLPGWHTVKYSLSLINSNYVFDNEATAITGTSGVFISEAPNPEHINATSSTGDNSIFAIMLLIGIVLISGAYIKISTRRMDRKYSRP